MGKVKIGLIGAGWMGSEHGRNIVRNPAAELAAVCDTDAAKVEALRKDTGAAFKVYADHREMLKGGLDAVIIASPNARHAAMCLDAAKAGVHIYCEKPMAITADDCRRVRDAVAKAGVKYLIGYHRRLNPLYQYARRLMEEGRLGKPYLIESDYIHHIPGDLGIWSWLGKESVAGSLFHAGSGHNVDLIRYFCGDLAEVYCMKDTFLPRAQQIETEDTAIALFRFESGAMGKVQCCIGPVTPFRFAFRLYGTKGSVQDNKVWLDTIPRFEDPAHAQDCIELPASWVPDNVQGGVSETWKALTDHFVDMLVRDVACLNDVHSALKTSLACFGAMESAQTGNPVSLKGAA